MHNCIEIIYMLYSGRRHRLVVQCKCIYKSNGASWYQDQRDDREQTHVQEENQDAQVS
jgi:hypothetical protein